MGKCYCDYCDVFLTNDSVAVRKQHNDGNRHKYNVCEYYRQYIGQKLQDEIDEIVARFEEKVARGLIRPTYGLPPPAKPPVVSPTSGEPAENETEVAPKAEEATKSEQGLEDDKPKVEGEVGEDVPMVVSVEGGKEDHPSQGMSGEAVLDAEREVKVPGNTDVTHSAPLEAEVS